MASTADFKNGLVIEYNNDLYTIVQFQHVKPGKGPAFVRTKLKSIKTGRVIDNTFSSGTKVNLARVERRPTSIFTRMIWDTISCIWKHMSRYMSRNR
jgi:elongation factor P